MMRRSEAYSHINTIPNALNKMSTCFTKSTIAQCIAKQVTIKKRKTHSNTKQQHSVQ